MECGLAAAPYLPTEATQGTMEEPIIAQLLDTSLTPFKKLDSGFTTPAFTFMVANIYMTDRKHNVVLRSLLRFEVLKVAY